MKRIWSMLAVLSACLPFATSQTSRADTAVIDLTRWTPPDISTVGDDPFGELVKYGHELFTNTANEIGPAAADISKRLAGSNLACQNCAICRPVRSPMPCL
jgi:thiosulfate dehydrogenase